MLVWQQEIKKRLQLSDSDSQFNHEGEYGQIPRLTSSSNVVVIAIILLVVFSGQQSEKYHPTSTSSSSTQDLPVPVAPSVSNETQNVPNTLPPAQGIA